jgi:hypothetical protein
VQSYEKKQESSNDYIRFYMVSGTLTESFVVLLHAETFKLKEIIVWKELGDGLARRTR